MGAHRRVSAVTASVAALAAGWTVMLAPAAAADGDATVVVRGVALPVTGHTQVAVVGCADVFTHSDALARPMMGISPRPAPAGARSLAFAPTAGDAVGPLGYVDGVAATTVAQMAVLPRTGGAGVAYVGYQAPADVGTATMWVGRADVALAAGRWSTLDATRLTYTWTQYDMDTQLPAEVAPAPATVASFVRDHGGDGYGFYALGMGCDGAEFNTDAWRIGGPGATATYDFEGYPTATSVVGPGAPVAPGTPVTLAGHVSDASGAPLEGWAVLERRGPGGWEPVDGVDANGPTLSATVTPEETTTYRWRLVDRARYEGSVSAPITVWVEQPSLSPSPSPSAEVPGVPAVTGASRQASGPATPAAPTSGAPASETPTEAGSDIPAAVSPDLPTSTPVDGDPVTTAP